MSKKIVLAALLVGSLAWAGCDQVNPQPNPTYGGPNGECIEADGEPCDDDPFDLDDAFEHGKRKTPAPYPLKKTPGPRVTSKVRR